MPRLGRKRMDREDREKERETNRVYESKAAKRVLECFKLASHEMGSALSRLEYHTAEIEKARPLQSRGLALSVEEARPKSAISIDTDYRLIAYHRRDPIPPPNDTLRNLPRLLPLLFGNTLTSVVSVIPILPTPRVAYPDYYQSFSVLLPFD